MRPYNPEADSFTHMSDRLVIVGPPGTGKTSTALRDFLKPAFDSLPPDRVLACSFSNAAANEIRERLGGGAWLRESVSTIHSEALRRVKIAAGDDLKLYDPATDTVKKFSRTEAPEPGESSDVGDIAVAAWDMARALLVHEDPKQVHGWCAHFAARKKQPLARAAVDEIAYFEQRKREEGALDFTDMLLRALHLPARMSGYGLLLVDEVQDCTPLQWALIDHWSSAADKVVLIGDPDQCIHEWMGASYRQLISRVREWPARVLAQSWRVPLAAHGLARGVVSMIEDREDAEYSPADRDGSAVTCGQDDVITRAREVAQEYVDAPEEYDHTTGEVVAGATPEMFILARTNRDVARLRKALNEAGIPYADEHPGKPRSFAVATARRARCVVDLLAGKSVDVEVVRDTLAQVPSKGWFDGTKKSRLDSLPEPGSVTLSDLPWFNAGSSAVALLGAMKLAGDPAYWAQIAENYGAWVLTDPPPVRVLTMHRSKGREADVVAVCAEKSNAVLFGGVDDAELRLLYVAVTRTKDELLLFSRPGYEVYGELEIEEVAF